MAHFSIAGTLPLNVDVDCYPTTTGASVGSNNFRILNGRRLKWNVCKITFFEEKNNDRINSEQKQTSNKAKVGDLATKNAKVDDFTEQL